MTGTATLNRLDPTVFVEVSSAAWWGYRVHQHLNDMRRALRAGNAEMAWAYADLARLAAMYAATCARVGGSA
jgi:hypothetical protein